ncbi:MAG: hypothetical protein QXF26_09820 [Candidatus Bathyarchaeia archaeon]
MRTMIFEKAILDLVDPTAASYMLFIEAIVVIIEAAVIYSLLERALAKAFISSICANFVTALLSFFYLIFSIEETFTTYLKVVLVAIVPLVINILVEAGILRLFYAEAPLKRVLKTSVVMNIASYALVIIDRLHLLTS